MAGTLEVHSERCISLDFGLLFFLIYSQSRRTEEEVHVQAQAAGLARSHGPVQLLRFSSHLNAQDLKLMELPCDVLEALKKGDR